MEPVTARFAWTAEDLITGRKYATKSKSLRLILTFIFAMAVIAVSIFIHDHWSGRNPHHDYSLEAKLATVGILLFAILMAFIALFAGRKIETIILRRQFSKRPDANIEVVWIANDQGISISSTSSKTETQWSAFQQVISTSAGFLFMPNRQIFHFIPNRAFSSQADIENLKILARQHATEFKELK